PPQHDQRQGAAHAPDVAEVAAGHLEQGVAQDEGAEHQAHPGLAQAEVGPDVALDLRDADAVQVRDQRQGTGEEEHDEADAGRPGGGGKVHEWRSAFHGPGFNSKRATPSIPPRSSGDRGKVRSWPAAWYFLARLLDALVSAPVDSIVSFATGFGAE